MFGFIRNASLKWKLLCSFALVMLVPGILIGFMSYDMAKTKVGQQLTRSAEENVNLLDQIITDNVSSRMKDLDYMSRLIGHAELQGKDPKVLRLMDDYMKLHPEMNTVFLGTPEGAFFNSPRVKMADDFDARKRPWYAEGMNQKDKVAVTAPYISKTTGDYVISLAKMLSDGSGVIGAEIKLKDLEAIAKNVSIGEKGFAVLVDQQRKAIVHPEFGPGEEVKADWVDDVFRNDSGEVTYAAGDSTKRMEYRTNKLTGWKIGGVMEEAELQEQAAPILKRMLMVLLASFVVFGTLAAVIVWLITKPIRELTVAAAKISEGDLTQRARVRGKDEIGRLAQSFNAMTDSLRGLLAEISELSMQLAASSEQLTASADQTSKATEQIAESVQEVAESAERQVHSVDQGFDSIRGMAGGISRIAEGTQEVSQSAEEASGQSGEGSAVMGEAIERMKLVMDQVHNLEQVIRMLSERSAAIGQIAGVMSGIAQQTNILSINAAIEASRAGEQGRGLAIVAQEVKKLAEQSRSSAGQIREMIESVQKETVSAVTVTAAAVEGVAGGSESIRRAGELFSSIKTRLYDMAKQAKTMSTAADTVSTESAHAVEAMEQVSDSTSVTAEGTQSVSAAAQEQLAAMEEIASSSAALAKMAENMQQLISRFQV